MATLTGTAIIILCVAFVLVMNMYLSGLSAMHGKIYLRIENLTADIDKITSILRRSASNAPGIEIRRERFEVSNKSYIAENNKIYKAIPLIKKPICQRPYELLVLVQSHISHFDKRMSIRKTWGNQSIFTHRIWKTYFLVAMSDRKQDLLDLWKEFDQFEDLIVGNTYEDFYQLSLKVRMDFTWFIKYCRFKYLLQADDDVYVNIKKLFEFLGQDITPKTKLYAGNVQYYATVFRSGRYAVSEKEYWKQVYPRYCSGGGFILSTDVVQAMHEIFNHVPPMKIEDAYIGELALSCGVDAFHSNAFHMYHGQCIFDNNTIVYHPVKNDVCMNTLFEGQLLS